MRRMLTRAGIALALLSPAFALAAYNDVSLTTDTVLTVNGITLNVSGSSAAVESITVDTSTFSITLPPSASIEVTAPGLEQLTADTGSGKSKDICNATQSVLGYAVPSTNVGSVTVTITPIATLCSSSGSGGSAPAGGGGGGGGGSSTPTTQTQATTTITTTTTSSAPTTTTTTTTVPASGLTRAQIDSILNLLRSFDADASVIASVKTSLEGGTVSGTPASGTTFSRDLSVGSVGDDAKALQQFLNSKGFMVAASGLGSPGNESRRFGPATKAALIKYQKAKGISPASGYFGPLTRAAVNADQ